MAMATFAATAMENVASTAIGGAASEVAKTGVRAASGDASEDPVSRDALSQRGTVAIKAVEILATAIVTGGALMAFSKASETVRSVRVRLAIAAALAVSSALATACMKTALSK